MMKLSCLLLFFCGTLIAAPVSPQQIREAEFVAKGKAFYDSGKGTPAEYITNMRGKLIREAAIVRGEDCGNYQEAVRKLSDCHEKAQTGFAWKQSPAVLSLKRLSQKPKIDGSVCPDEWGEANRFQGEFQLGKTTKNQFADTQWRIGVYGESLFVAAEFQDSDQSIVSYRPGESMPWTGDALEFFIRPDVEDGFYYELVINPSGELCMFWHLNNPYGGYTRLKECVNTAVKVKTCRTSKGFSFELELPMNELLPAYCRHLPKSGDSFGFMLIRINRDSSDRRLSAPVPFLYDGHNIFGYIRAIFP